MARTIPPPRGSWPISLRENFAGRKIWLIYGALRDKAVDEVAGLLFPLAAEVIITEPRTPRSISASQLAEIAGHHARHFAIIPDAEQAWTMRWPKPQPEDAIFITGSLYLVGQLRAYWKKQSQGRRELQNTVEYPPRRLRRFRR